MLLSQVIIQCRQSKRRNGFSCMAVNGCLAAHSIYPAVCFSTSSPPFMFWFEPQGSESESVNGPGRDSGLASSRLDPSATLPSRGGAESEPEAMEGMLCRKQEMESHSKKAATRLVLSWGELVNCIIIDIRGVTQDFILANIFVKFNCWSCHSPV